MKRKKFPFTKRFQTKLQSLVAYSAYDTEELSGAGSSLNVMTLIDLMKVLYFPPTNKKDDRVSHVERLLERNGKYKHLFEEGEKGLPTIHEKFHRMEGKEIYIGDGCIDLSMLTRKNLTNMVDVSGETLWRHAKDVEKNCKKALSLCQSDECPYKDYNGTFQSGHNWDQYLEWVRVEMYNLLETEIDEISLDPDDIPSTVDGDVEEEEDDGLNAEKNKEEAIELEKEGPENKESIGTKESDKDKEDNSYCELVKDAVPHDWYFKGYLAFALWGFIPAPGGEAYKSLLMQGVMKGETKGGTRKEICLLKKERSDADRLLDKRGETAANVDSSTDKQLSDLLLRGRFEAQAQKIYETKVQKLEYQMHFQSEKMKDYKEEIGFLDPSEKEERKELRDKWKQCSKEKDKLYLEWKQLTETESLRREGVEMQWKNTTDVFEDASEITKETPLKNRDRTPLSKETENGTNIILNLTKNDLTNKTAPTIEESPDAEICKNNNSKSVFDVKKNGIGVLPTAKCTYCKDMNTSHYCQQKVIGTGCFVDGNEVCGHIMCVKCVLEWDGLAETYRGICRECKDSKECKEKGKTGKNEDEINEKEKTGKDNKKRKLPSNGTKGKSGNTKKKTATKQKVDARVISTTRNSRSSRSSRRANNV